MASKRGNRAPRMPLASSNEDSFSPAGRKSDGSDGDEERDNGDERWSSDEIGENGVLITRVPPAKGMAPVDEPATKNTASRMKRKGAKSPPRKKKKKKTKATTAAAAEHARSPSPEKDATAAASEAAVSSPRKQVAADETTAVSTDLAGAVEDQQQHKDESDAAEKHLKKSETHWYLWQMVLALETEHSLFYKGAFLKLDGAKATSLDTKIKQLCLREINQHLRRKAIQKEVTNMVIKLIQ